MSVSANYKRRSTCWNPTSWSTRCRWNASDFGALWILNNSFDFTTFVSPCVCTKSKTSIWIVNQTWHGELQYLVSPSQQTTLERRKNSSAYGKSNGSPFTGLLSAKQGGNTNCSAHFETRTWNTHQSSWSGKYWRPAKRCPSLLFYGVRSRFLTG